MLGKQINMHKLRILSWLFIILLIFSATSYASTPKSETIAINEMENTYELTVPISKLFMTLPKKGLSLKQGSIGGGTDNPRYFYFEDKARNIIISGWFESDLNFTNINTFWENETKAWKRGGLPEPKNVLFTKISNWDAILYDITAPGGNNTHIRAHWLQSGTWIDIHLSITSNRPVTELKATLESLLSAIQVKEKSVHGDSVQESGIRRYSLPRHGSLQLSAPASWSDDYLEPRDNFPTITYTQSNGAPFNILITLIWSGKGRSPLPSVDQLKQRVWQSAEQVRPQAVEKTIGVKELKGTAASGYYFTATDRAPKAGEFKHMTQGMMRVGDLMVIFTVLTNDGQSNIIDQALAMMKSAYHTVGKGI